MCGVPRIADYDRIYNDVFATLSKGFMKLNDALSLVNAGMKRDCFYSHISSKQESDIRDLIEKNQREHHRTSETYLGKMCRFGHEHENTGKGLRYKANSLCVICHRNGEMVNGIIPDYRLPIEDVLSQHPLHSDAHYIGRICPNNHKYHGHNYSLRYKCNKVCVHCHRDNLHLEDGAKRLNMSMSHGIRRSLKGGKNGISWRSMVNYDLIDLRSRLERKFDLFMNWDNYGTYWELDHIIPKSYFQYTSSTDTSFQQCWSLDNLQPLETKANQIKSNKIKKKYGNLPSNRL
jgi:hypothetical protein